MTRSFSWPGERRGADAGAVLQRLVDGEADPCVQEGCRGPAQVGSGHRAAQHAGRGGGAEVHGHVASEAIAVAIGEAEQMREGAAGHVGVRSPGQRLLGLLDGGHDRPADQAGRDALRQCGG